MISEVEAIRALMRKGMDTQSIALRLRCSEAAVYNILVRDGLPESASVAGRLAPVRGRSSLTAPGASAPGGFSPVVVRNEGGKAQGVKKVDFTCDVARESGGLVVHRFGSGGIGPQ